MPRYWLSEINGIPVLAVERFDRSQNQTPLFTETLYSILACGDSDITHHYSYSYDAIGHAIDKSPIDIISQRKAGKEHLFKRLLIAFLTGNGDLHLENLSVTINNNQAEFTRIYDPTPMRAYTIHNMLSVMPFGDYGQIIEKRHTPVGLVEAIERLARNLQIRNPQVQQLIHDALQATESYADRIAQLQTLPGLNRDHLISIVNKVRQQIGNMI